uniref:Ig-like domain-containing protein n=1 Tax=Haplochromis burtoni TaxID=8153 RepID=A0A3Q3C153_HAPBU
MIAVVSIFCFLHLPEMTGRENNNTNDKTHNVLLKISVFNVIFFRIGESVESEIKCSHSIPGYQVILWYKQDEKGVLQFLGYLNLELTKTEKDGKGKISFDGDGQKYSNLAISDVSVTDSAVYFCAASQHSTTDSTESHLKLN